MVYVWVIKGTRKSKKNLTGKLTTCYLYWKKIERWEQQRKFKFTSRKQINHDMVKHEKRTTDKQQLCSRHTVPKMTPNGHTYMKYWSLREDGPEFGQQPFNNNRFEYDAYRRSHDDTEPQTRRVKWTAEFNAKINFRMVLRDCFWYTKDLAAANDREV